jgi:hypothetical protein
VVAAGVVTLGLVAGFNDLSDRQRTAQLIRNEPTATPVETVEAAASAPAAPVPTGPNIPAGFRDQGNGLAVQFIDGVCEYAHCVTLEVYAYEACPSLVYVEGNVIDALDRVIGLTNDTLGSLSAGQTGLVTLTFTEDAGEKVRISDTACY